MNKVWYPWQRVIRTAVQVFLAVATILATVAVVAPQIIDALADVLPGPVLAWLTAATVVVATLSAALSRVMLIPQVNEFLQKFGAGTAPDGAVAVTLITGDHVPMTRKEYRDYRQSLADDADQANAERNRE